MPATPCQTYLEERLQSARGLGWSVPPSTTRDPEEAAASVQNQVSGAGDKVLFPLLRWLGLAA